MKTFTSILVVFGSIAGVVAPGFASAGVYIPVSLVVAVLSVVAALVGYAIITSSVDHARTGSSFATNYKTAKPVAPVVKMLPAATQVREKRRVSAIVEIAA